MIWHFFEVWLLMVVAFAIGCPLGALAYRLIAGSPLADLQGDVADVVGDLVDGIKSRLGIGPVWRPEYRRLVERHGGEDMDDAGSLLDEAAGRPERLSAGGVPLLADHSDEALAGTAGDRAGAPAEPDEPEEPAEEETTLARPVGLAAPRNGVPDDLQRIRGIGRRIEQRLNALGIYHFGQIAAWTPAEMRWMAQHLAFPERIEWDDWIGQAIVLAAGGDTGFVKSADRRRARRRQEALEAAIARETEADDSNGLEVLESAVGDDAGAEAEAAIHPESTEAIAPDDAEAEADAPTDLESPEQLPEGNAGEGDGQGPKTPANPATGGEAGADKDGEPEPVERLP